MTTNPLKNYLSNTKFGYPFDELRGSEQEYIVQMLRVIGDNLVGALRRAYIPEDFTRALSPLDHAKTHAQKVKARKHNDNLLFAEVILSEELK